MPDGAKTDGYVYILTSPNSDSVKIGGTATPPMKRIKEINATEPYKSFGVWSLYDFRGVTDWRKAEHSLHYIFRSKLNKTVAGQKELFLLNPYDAARHLDSIDPDAITYKPRVDRMFNDAALSDYLLKLFVFAGLDNWLDLQGGWTLSLFPGTVGGRYFTLNIANHEVAFGSLPKKDVEQINMLFMDSLVLDFNDVVYWLKHNMGDVVSGGYATSLPRGISVLIAGSFDKMREFLNLPGVRRAILAYWTEALLKLRDANSLSLYSRHHNYNAVAAIAKQLRQHRMV